MRRRDMTDWRRSLAAAVLGLALAPQPAGARQLEVRIAPGDVVYLNDNNLRLGITDLMIQTISVTNCAGVAAHLRELLIEVDRDGEVIAADRLPASAYREVWTAFYPMFADPERQKADDMIVLFSRAVPAGVTLSPTLTLAPNTAVLVRNRLLAISGYLLPDAVRVTATATVRDGRTLRGTAQVPVRRYETANAFIFPLRGRWYVAASSSARSHHRARAAHEFALDLTQVGPGGKSFRTDGATPADYYAFGAEVLAVADGTVIASAATIPATEMPRPGETRAEFAERVLDAMWEADPRGRVAGGNHVVIEHAGGEYSIYAHLRHGSVTVGPGDRVRQGQVIGQVGISGDGFEPHLHFSVNDSPDINYGHSLPATFTNVRPVGFSSTIDLRGDRLFLAGEFVETAER